MARGQKVYIDPDIDLDDDEDELNAEKIAGGFLKGVLKIAGLALMAVIAGYSAGIAQENYRASRANTVDAHR